MIEYDLKQKGDIIVKSSNLRPIYASKKYYVNSTDEYPILFVIAALTNGISRFKGIGDLANKESNRIKEMQKILKQIGISVSWGMQFQEPYFLIFILSILFIILLIINNQ